MDEFENMEFDWDDVNDEFPGLPQNIYAYENQFNYCVWTPNTDIVLCTVPWDSMYRDTVMFSSEEKRDDYFSSLDSYSIKLNGYVYLRYGEPIRIQVPFGEAIRYNYIAVYNKLQPVPHYKDDISPRAEEFFYFINDVKYIAPNTTELTIQLDVWQTYIYRCNIGRSFLERGHAAISNSNLNDYNVNQYLLEPEGLEQGNEYETIDIEQFRWVNWEELLESHTYDKAPLWAIVVSAADLTADFGTLEDPNLKTANGSVVEMIPEGCECYIMNLFEYINFNQQISNYPWVSQCISFVSVLPKTIIPFSEDTEKLEKAKVMICQGNIEAYDLAKFPWLDYDGIGKWTVEGWRNIFDTYIPDEYSLLRKFKTFPFAAIEMTTLTGGEIILKPECLQSEDVEGVGSKDDITVIYDTNVTPPNMRTVIYPACYNGNIVCDNPAYTNSTRATLYGGDNMDMAITVSNWPQCSIVNNMYLYYMASTVNTRNYQFADASWAQDRSLMAANNAYLLAGANMQNQRYQSQNQSRYYNEMNSANQEHMFWGTLNNAIGAGLNLAGTAAGTLGNGAAGLMNIDPGQLASAAGNGINSALSTVGSFITNTGNFRNNEMMNMTQRDLANALQIGNTQANIGYLQYSADHNYELAQRTAQGDYEMAIQGIQAKCEDARLKQPTTSGQNAGDTYNISRELSGLYLKFKMPKLHFVRQIGDFWLRYGCSVNRWVIPPKDLKLMEHFTYWKFGYCALTGQLPNAHRDALRGVLEKGVTVWTNPSEIWDVPLYNNGIASNWGY